MKNSSFIIHSSSFLMLVVLLLAPSCDKFHDNIQPADQLPIGSVYQSVADLESALNGVYSTLQGSGLAGTYLFVVPEVMGGNAKVLISAGNPDQIDLGKRDLRSSNYFAEDIWVTAYKAINLANAVLAALETVQDAALTPEVRGRIEGEALFVRGWLYFELVRYFGQPFGDTGAENGVPLMTKAVLKKSDLTFPFRAAVQQVYDQATADLTRAKDLLPTSQSTDRANPRAALGLLARLAFQKGDNAQAAAFCKTLLDDPALSLTATPGEFFANESSPENIWSIRFTPADGEGLTGWFGEAVGFIGISDALKTAFGGIVTPAQKAAADAEGLAIVDLRAMPPLVSADSNFTSKYEDVATKADDAPMLRLAEIVLMRAEAIARAGDLAGGTALLNQIRARSLRVRDVAGLEPADKQSLALFAPGDFADADALVDAIVLERRVELCFEGNFMQDMIRLHRPIEGLPFDSCRLRLPIPQREMDANRNLKQNPCY